MTGDWTVLGFESIDSTQEEARRRLAAGERLTRTVLRAERQSAGLGRFGRAFASPTGGSWQTFVTHDPDGRFRDSRLPSRAAARVADALETLGATVRLKWPNDVWCRASDGPHLWAKAGGLLLEHRSEHLLVGVGLNAANDPPPGGARLGLPAGDVSDAVLAAIVALIADPDATDPAQAWRGRHLLDGRTVVVANGANGETVRGRVVGLASDGGLRLIDADGQERIVRSGTIASVAPPLVPESLESGSRGPESAATDVRPTDTDANGC